jgi:hypothetical protein
MILVGIVGFIGSGKGTAGDVLVSKGFKADSFAKPLKDSVAIIFGWDRNLLEGDTKESRKWREVPDEYWSKVYGYSFTPRLALQLFGTEACRSGLHQDIWIHSLMTRIKGHQRVVVTDVRFKNEVEAIQKVNGTIVRIKRGPEPIWYDGLKNVYHDQHKENFMNIYGIHRSEWDWVGCDFDVVIENDGTLEDLQEKINNLF